MRPARENHAIFHLAENSKLSQSMDVFNIKINVFDTFFKKVISRTAMVEMGVLAKNEREGRCVLGESIFQ